MPRQQKSKRNKNVGSVGASSFPSYRNAATTSVRGSARGDQVYALPLLGDKYENRAMLYYDRSFELTSPTGLLKTWYFRANDVYDPDATGTGHQPIGFDQAMLFWEQFCVFSSKISVTFMSNSNAIVRVGIFVNPDTTDPISNQDLMENGFVKSNVVFGTSTSTGGGAFHTVKNVQMTLDNVKYFSSKNKETYFANPNFTGTAAASPAEMAYFGVFAFEMEGGNTTDVWFDVTLSYDVRFWEPRKVSTSFLKGLGNVPYEEVKSNVCEGKELQPPKAALIRSNVRK